MHTIDGQLGQKISRHRRFVGLTQAQLAEKVGVEPETISRLENGHRAASLSLIEKVAAAFDLHLHELLHLRTDTPKERALERLVLFAARLSPAEIELVLSVGASVVDHTRRSQQR